jgi:hypothetical protein
MQGFHIKSILIGLGMGIIIAAILGIICYNAGASSVSKPSKEEVIQLAKSYGMIDPTDLIKGQSDQTNQNSDKSTIKVNSDDNTPTSPADSTTKSSTTNKATTDNADTKQQDQPKILSIVINSGDSTQTIAERLVNSGLIANKNDFFNKLTALGLSEKIETGEFKIRTGATVEDIVRIITKTKK